MTAVTPGTGCGLRWAGARIVSGSALYAVAAVAFGVTAVVVARQVTPAVFGELAAGMAIALVGGDVLDFGRSKALIGLQARGDTATVTAARVLLRSKLVASPMVLAALAAFSLVLTGTLRWHILAFWLYAIPATTWLTLCVPIRARAELGVAASCVLQERLVALAVVAIGLPTLGAISLPLGLAAGAATVCARLARPGWLAEGRQPDQAAFAATSRRFAVVSLTTDARQLDVPLVATLATAGIGGLFAAASRLVGPLSIIGRQASVLVFAAASTTRDRMTTRGLLSVLVTLTALYGPLLALLTWFREPFVTTLLGADYAWSAGLIPGLCLGLLLALVNDPLVSWAQAQGRAGLASLACTVSLVAYLLVLALGAWSGSLVVLALSFPVLNGLSLAILLMGLRAAPPGRQAPASQPIAGTVPAPRTPC